MVGLILDIFIYPLPPLGLNDCIRGGSEVESKVIKVEAKSKKSICVYVEIGKKEIEASSIE